MSAVRKQWVHLARLAVLGGAIAAAGVVGYEIRSADASGIPSAALSYSGSLLTFGQPDNASHTMTAALYASGTQVCVSPTTNVTCVNGQFTIPLPTNCTTAVQNNPNLTVEVLVDGTTLGPTAVSAVPYAVEAGNVPAGGVTGVLAVANGGTNSSTQNFVDLSSAQTVGGAKTFTSGVTFGDGTVQTSASYDTDTSPVFMASQADVGSGYPNDGARFIFPGVSVNVGNGYSASTGAFTAPIAGYYQFSYMITANIECCSNNVNDVDFAYNGGVNEAVSAVTTCVNGASTFSTWCPAASTAVFHMNVNDTMAVLRTCCDNEQPLSWRATFTGRYVHP